MIVSHKRLFCLALIGCLLLAMTAQVRARVDADEEGSKEKQAEGDENIAEAKDEKDEEPARHHGSTRRLRAHRRHQKRSNMPAIQFPGFEGQYQYPQARHHRNRNHGRSRSISISISGERRGNRRVFVASPAQQAPPQYQQALPRAENPRRRRRRNNRRRRPQVIFVRDRSHQSSSSEEPKEQNIRVRTRNLNRNFNFMRSNNPVVSAPSTLCCCGLSLASICSPCPCGSLLCTPLAQAAQCTPEAPNCACTGVGAPLVGCAPTCQATPITGP